MDLGAPTEAKQRMTFRERLRETGPSAMITGAIVGPGTVTTCTVIGIKYQYALLWVCLLLLFFHFALRDMTARLGLCGGKTFQQAIREDIENPILRNITITIVAVAVGIACLSFQFGSIMGAGLGLQFFFPNVEASSLAAIIGLVCIPLILSGSYKTIETAIKYMILAFSISFLATVLVSGPSLGAILKGLFVPSIPKGALPNVLSLVGTTGIGGYTLFLHTNSIREKWSGPEDLYKARNDIFIMAPIAVITTAMIMISAGSMYSTGVEVSSAAVMGEQFAPIYGDFAKYIFAVGLSSAGISSAIPVAMASSWILTGVLGYESTMESKPFRIATVIHLVLGSIMAYYGRRPVQLILSAQAVNGVLGPITAIILLVLANKKSLMKDYTNSTLVNVVGIVAVIFGLVISFRSLASMF
ncbi:MAG TPA: Nramp family divalent metal transporter [Clostridiales bacterium]|nr:Nramp family divalent metal transporter [Clostridiales bacterium]